MIRKAQMQDLSRIAEIIVFGKRVAYRSIFQDDNGSFNELQVLKLADTYRSNQTLLADMLVYDDGIVKGVLNRKVLRKDVEICELYVEPFFKGMGIGSKLFEYAINEAKDVGKKKLFLWVIEENLSARKFYEAHGFRAIGETCVIEGTDKLDMRYELVLN